MTPEETAKVLAEIALYDNRRVDAPTVAAWHRIIGKLDYADAHAAVVAHFSESSDWVQPRHIIEQAKRIRSARQAPGAGYGPDAPPPELADRPMDYAAVLRRIQQLAGGAGMPFRALEGGGRRGGPSDEYKRARDGLSARRSAREAVLSYPDLAQRLTEPPLGYETPAQWTGYIPPAEWGGKENESPRRRALVEIVEEAYRRDAAANGAA